MKFLSSRYVVSVALTVSLGTLLCAARGEETKSLADFPSTAHFWYRLQPAGPYIDSQRDNKAFGYRDGKILLSEDNGRTWPHSVAFPDAQKITFSRILKNGNILFATGAKLYLSTDNLKTYKPITVKDANGRDYLPHTPKNPDHPGWYFHTLPGINSWDVDGKEMLVWGNYCNVIGGATPVNIYYSTDSGQTVKIAYAFGQNPNFRDNGSGGGGKTGTLLGDPDNPVICRHVHSVAYNPAENAFYACTGDGDRPEGNECHWLRGTYDAANGPMAVEGHRLRQPELALQVRRHQLRRRQVLLDQRRERPQALRPRHLLLRPGRHRQSRKAHDAVQSGGRVGQHDHPGRRDPGLALCARLADGHGNHRFHRHGQDLGPVRSEGVRPAVAHPLPREEQRRLVPRGPADRLGDTGRRDVHQAQAGSRGAKQLIVSPPRPEPETGSPRPPIC